MINTLNYLKNKKEFKYYICSKNIYIYNEDVITGNTEFEINILISLIIYNYFYEKGADENLYEKIYNDIQLLTRTKTNDCDNKIIITNTIGLTNSEFIKIIKFYNENFKKFNGGAIDEGEDKIELLRLLEISYYNDANIIYNFMSKNYPSFEEIYNNINDVINDKNMIINTQSDEYNTYNDESKLRTFNIVKTHFELNEYTGYETLLKQFLLIKIRKKALRSTLSDLKKEKLIYWYNILIIIIFLIQIF